MKTTKVILVLLLCPWFMLGEDKPIPWAPCSVYDTGVTGPPAFAQDTQQHVNGLHSALLQDHALCIYGPGYTGNTCPVAVTGSGQALSVMGEYGTLTSGVGFHNAQLGFYVAQEAGGLSPQTVTPATNGAVRSCATPNNCSFSETVGFPPFTVTYSPANSELWAFHETSALTCAQQTGAVCYPPVGGCGPKYIWDYINCACVFVGGSPILIDTRNSGFKLSAPKAGSCVPFDLLGDGQKQCWSWPEAGSGNGWLVYPYRTHPGSKDTNLAVASGKDMFGSMTEQMKIEFLSSPCKEHPETCNQDNGYAALQILKQPSQGGYQDYDNPDESLILSTKDKQWKKLRIWIDENRDGIAQPYELHELSEYDIHNISLNAAMTDRKDEYGNWCRYAAPLNVELKDVRSWAIENDARRTGGPRQANAQTCDWFLVNSGHK
jgi:hypothetical protein